MTSRQGPDKLGYMKNINIELTPIQAVMLYRLINRNFSEVITDFGKGQLQAGSGQDVRSDILEDSLKEWASYGYGSIYSKLAEALQDADIYPNRYPEVPIRVGEYYVTFDKGSVRVGCMTVPNEVVKQIAAKLVD